MRAYAIRFFDRIANMRICFPYCKWCKWLKIVNMQLVFYGFMYR